MGRTRIRWIYNTDPERSHFYRVDHEQGSNYVVAPSKELAEYEVRRRFVIVGEVVVIQVSHNLLISQAYGPVN